LPSRGRATPDRRSLIRPRVGAARPDSVFSFRCFSGSAGTRGSASATVSGSPLADGLAAGLGAALPDADAVAVGTAFDAVAGTAVAGTETAGREGRAATVVGVGSSFRVS